VSASGGTLPVSDILGGATTDLQASSGSVAAAVATATLPAAAGKTTYLTGFTFTGSGATAASVVLLTVTGPATTLTFVVAVPAGATLGCTPITVRFDRAVPASAPNTAIVVSVPSLGAGNTNAAVVATGYQQ
jgi:hypothetical protein